MPLGLLQALAEGTDEALRVGLAHVQVAEFLYETCLFPDAVCGGLGMRLDENFSKIFVVIVGIAFYALVEQRDVVPLLALNLSHLTLAGGYAMPVSVSQLLASADTGGDALRLIRAALNLTQADLVARADGTLGTDQISLIERGKRPMTSKQCTAIAQALHLTDDDEAQLILLAQIDRAPERLKPILRQARLRAMLDTVEAFLTAYPADKIAAFIATLDALAEVWPAVKARGLSPQNALHTGPQPSEASPEGTEDGV